MSHIAEHEDDLSFNLSEKPAVLIIDDCIDNIQILTEILSYQYHVFSATSGPQGLKKALENRVDLILLDIRMPGMDGYEVCKQLKSHSETRDIGVIFVTAVHEIDNEARGLDLGALDYIVKPFSLRIIEARIRNHMELVRHRKVLKNLSLTDGLTGIPNRRYFDQVLLREWHRCQRQQSLLAVILIDIDHFKKYNDYFGHLEGDLCLKKFAKVVDACRRRKTDLVARFGGEEFAAVLPDTSPTGALNMAERILQSLRKERIPHPLDDQSGIVTASIGLFSAVPDTQTAPEELIDCADKALYKAKKAGRNRVIIYNGV